MLRSNNLQKIRNTFLPALRTYKTSGIPELTEVRHNIKRGNYAELNGKDVSFFESLIGPTNILQDSTDDLQGYNVDFLRSVRGRSQLVLKPGSTQEISEILKYCNERRLAVCPQGGNTGLVGGSVPVCDEIVLSLARLNKILSIDDITGITACESGVILENLDAKTREAGFVVPLDLGAKSSCHIGGNISTNAGGLRVIRYGNLHGSVLGVEAVLANGKVIDLMSDFKKDNTGYHLKHLFIGSEGTLGVVTKLAILCPAISDSVNVAFLALNSFEAVMQTLKNAKRHLGEILSSCELIDAPSLAASIENNNLQSPIEGYPFYMLIETSGSNAEHDMEKLNNFIQLVMDKGDVVDGTYTSEPSKMLEIWKLREFISTALTKDGYCFKYDISLPLRSFYDIVKVVEKRAGHLAKRVTGYGHLGDLNLHLNVSCEQYSPELYKLLEPFIYEYTAQLKGSVSAEHGIGFLKTKYLKHSKSAEAINMMRDMKQLLDPNGILNPYKVLY
ncbi:D-2-hydroxyglutarate dehydrogenase, mitochondrial [Musca domestica]|uniref:D-2-hydroxyglutarate dehydrogenase, mitochondrial n=1 Tax=Musca domestica TaxID=7370 RepID=A0ABM3UTR7_MUSDO|nr:D-2-hydroxyglutarate dehydrogenase, mitochondrial [Musca domestica]XP_058976931.1 D-2-hydroxyglutarate dehydrogenase, mitochondrial [Musca domestica]